MTKIFTYATIVICLSASATLAINPRTIKPGTTEEAILAADGAYRDGLYLGKLTAERGQPQRLAVGRWSSDHDRAMFTAGYRRGYAETVTLARTGGAQPR